MARRLARDVIEVAEPILRHTQVLAIAELDAIARDLGANHAVVIAARRTLAEARETAKPLTPRPPRIEPDRRSNETGDMGIAGLFFSADPAARRMLLLSLGDAQAEPEQNVRPLETIRALEAAALGRDREGFIRLIESALSLTA